jgi:hypothetical protein
MTSSRGHPGGRPVESRLRVPVCGRLAVGQRAVNARGQPRKAPSWPRIRAVAPQT